MVKPVQQVESRVARDTMYWVVDRKANQEVKQAVEGRVERAVHQEVYRGVVEQLVDSRRQSRAIPLL